MTTFSFSTARTIHFGAGRSRDLASLVAPWGKRPFLVTGSDPARHASLAAGLADVSCWPVGAEPTLESVAEAVARARDHRADVVIGVGGGATLDTAKLIAGLAPNPGDTLDYLEVIGRGRSLEVDPLPVVAVPTTAGTGSEVTANGVVASAEHGVKVSLRHPGLLPVVALVDPELTLGCPPAVTASSGLDALTQCLEPFVSPMATPVTDGFCIEGLRRAGRGLRRAYHDGSDLAARTDMSLAATLSGMALANAKLGAVHGLAGVIGGMTGSPHGASCAAVLVATCAANVAALGRLDPQHSALRRYALAGELLGGEPTTEGLLAWLTDTVAALDVPGLDGLGLAVADHRDVCEKAAASSSMKGNPVVLGVDELMAVLEASR